MDYTTNTLKNLAKETKGTKRLFRINGSIYLYKGKFYKSDVFNIAYVTANVRPSVANINKTDTLYRVNEIVDEYKLQNVFNVK